MLNIGIPSSVRMAPELHSSRRILPASSSGRFWCQSIHPIQAFSKTDLREWAAKLKN